MLKEFPRDLKRIGAGGVSDNRPVCPRQHAAAAAGVRYV